MGYLLAFISSVFFSFYVIPRKLSNIPALTFSLLVGVGFFVASTLMYFTQSVNGLEEVWSWQLVWSVLAGIFWALGLVCFTKAIDIIGLARSNQWKNFQGPIGVLLSLLVLSEYTDANPFFAILAGLVIFASATAFNIVDSKHDQQSNQKGIRLALLSGLAFGSVTVINKYVTTEAGVYTQQVVWSAAIMTSVLMAMIFKKDIVEQFRRVDGKNALLGLLAGALYLGASFFMLESYKYIPASIGFTVIQLNAVWTILIGILIFKEINFKKHNKRITVGLVAAILGVLLLVLA